MNDKNIRNIPEYRNEYLKISASDFLRFIDSLDSSCKPEEIVDAVNHAISQIKVTGERNVYLKELISRAKVAFDITLVELEHRLGQGRVYADVSTSTRKNANVVFNSSHEFLNLDGVVRKYKLSRNNVKNKKWRDDNGFPYLQTVDGGSVTYKVQDVEKWIDEHKN